MEGDFTATLRQFSTEKRILDEKEKLNRLTMTEFCRIQRANAKLQLDQAKRNFEAHSSRISELVQEADASVDFFHNSVLNSEYTVSLSRARQNYFQVVERDFPIWMEQVTAQKNDLSLRFELQKKNMISGRAKSEKVMEDFRAIKLTSLSSKLDSENDKLDTPLVERLIIQPLPASSNSNIDPPKLLKPLANQRQAILTTSVEIPVTLPSKPAESITSKPISVSKAMQEEEIKPRVTNRAVTNSNNFNNKTSAVQDIIMDKSLNDSSIVISSDARGLDSAVVKSEAKEEDDEFDFTNIF